MHEPCTGFFIVGAGLVDCIDLGYKKAAQCAAFNAVGPNGLEP